MTRGRIAVFPATGSAEGQKGPYSRLRPRFVGISTDRNDDATWDDYHVYYCGTLHETSDQVRERALEVIAAYADADHLAANLVIIPYDLVMAGQYPTARLDLIEGRGA